MRVIVRTDDEGLTTFASDEPVEIIVVSEYARDDRCYRMQPGGPAYEIGQEAVDAILGNSVIGHAEDGKHQHASEIVKAFLRGDGP